ncbi:hypothetical protein AX16_003055 [Volvariella volvacea WC 439]|nr:hypothetical protein AX16_003055 [Volvariella volvacea WC 439]
MSSADCVLPIELVETIFDYLLDPDCRDALKACSLASRSLSLPSHRRLFRHLSIVIHILPPLFINQRLTSLNSISPIRLSLVQAFSIRLISCNVNFDRNLLLQVLRSMVNLTQITFDCRWTSEPLVSKRNTGVTNADILQECCRPSITHLNLGDCHDFPSDDFYRCTSLTHLTLRNCAFLPPKGRLIALPRIPIKSLFLHTYWLPSEEGRGSTAVHFLRHPLCPWDISCLDSFGFFASKNQQFVELMEFMKYLPDSVTSFSAEIPAECKLDAFLSTAFAQ